MSKPSGANLNNTQNPQNAKLSGRKILLILAVVFLLPFTTAALLHLLDLKPEGKSYGDLIQPPKNLQFPLLKDVKGKSFKSQQWLKKWSVVIVDSTNCAAPCQAKMQLLKQVHTSLNKEIKRVQRVLLVPIDADAKALSDLQKKYPDLIILAGADAETVKFATEFKVTGGQVYLVDPLGNLMMSYSEKMDPKGLRSDLTRLLKNSWAG